MPDLNRLLKLLLENKFEFVLIGGYASVLYGSSQTTRDVDICMEINSNVILRLRSVLSPFRPWHRQTPKKLTFLEHPSDIAEEKLPSKWINTMPSRDEQFLAPGWRERLTVYYEGNHLRVFLIGRKDMVGLKIAAAFDRQRFDADDLLAMNPTPEEWAFGQEWARNYDANPDWPQLIDELVENLKERQGA